VAKAELIVGGLAAPFDLAQGKLEVVPLQNTGVEFSAAFEGLQNLCRSSSFANGQVAPGAIVSIRAILA
jgi:hypothetical protein